MSIAVKNQVHTLAVGQSASINQLVFSASVRFLLSSDDIVNC